MNIVKYYLIIAIAAGLFCAAVSGQTEQSIPNDKPLLINQPHPAFYEIVKLHVVVLQYDNRSEEDAPVWKQLEKNVKEKLRRVGIEIETPTADNILSIPELRIYISTLNLEDSQQCVFHIRTALARAVCLKNKPNPTFKADIWQAVPVIQAISMENISIKVNDVVMEQVEGFINIYKATNPVGRTSSEASINESASLTVPGKKDMDSSIIEHKYVASNSSAIFHKPECRWAKNISAQNLLSYTNKDEAMKAGKRPCKTCNP